MSKALEKLKEGIRTFQRDVYPARAEMYRTAATTPQKPHTLMITCADSRIDIEAITSSLPGELFISRNVGNIVPAYGQVIGGVSAVIEYAITALEVEHVVVCGHADCGAMKGLLAPLTLDEMPTVASWLQSAHAARSASQALAKPDERPSEGLMRLTERNVLLQLRHLKTHPSVAGALATAKISLSGWVYDIGTGHVRIAEDGEETFIHI